MPEPPSAPPRLRQPAGAVLLSIVLGIFLVDGIVSLLDGFLGLAGLGVLGWLRGLTSFFCLLTGLITYVVMGLTPRVPKRVFLPVSLLGPVTFLSLLLFSIYHLNALPQFSLLCSAIQVLIGVAIVRFTQGGFQPRWPLIRAEHLGTRLFSVWNLIGFVLANVLVLLPVVLLYLGFCAHLAVDHFSGGFLGLHADGLTSRAKTYVRADGRSIHLIPMMHIGDSSFYGQLSKGFPSNSIILLEGVSDEKHHLQDKLSYKKMADSLGLEEQHDNFEPAQGIARRADVDVDRFSESTLQLLNLVIRIHSKGPSLPLFLDLMAKGQDPRLADQLWKDLLTLRNAHLLGEIQTALGETDQVMVPWGAAHMPGLAEEIQKDGFKLTESRDYQIANFRTMWSRIGTRKR